MENSANDLGIGKEAGAMHLPHVGFESANPAQDMPVREITGGASAPVQIWSPKEKTGAPSPFFKTRNGVKSTVGFELDITTQCKIEVI